MKNIERRDFLRVLGWGGASATVSACGFTSIESGVETVQSYVNPEDFNVPGVGIYYASTCVQCEARCGVMGRVRDGRVLKLEGNPESNLSAGRLCGLGQAAVQHHYNPDRLSEPLVRDGGNLRPLARDKAVDQLAQRLLSAGAGRTAIVTGPLSGHLRVLVRNTAEALGAELFTYDALSSQVNRVASEQVLGSAAPVLAIDQARLIVSFGADFLDTGLSPVLMAGQYARFRKGNDGHERGVLVQIEPRMTLTGANADRWIGIRPGTQGVLALGLAHELLASAAAAAAAAPAGLVAAAKPYDRARVLAETGVSDEAYTRLLHLLQQRSPSLVLSGPSAEGQVNGLANAQAILLLNWVLGNVGKTIHAPARLPFPQIEAEPGTTSSLLRFASAAAAGRFDAVLFLGVNPVFTAPGAWKVSEALAHVPFKASVAQYRDETAAQCDLVLAADSAMEDWGTHIAAQQGESAQLTVQQPLMERLHPDGTRSTGDLMLEILRRKRPSEYSSFPDFYAYLRAALLRARAALPGNEGRTDDDFWTEALSRGVLAVRTEEGHLAAHAAATDLAVGAPPAADEAQWPLHLVPVVRAAHRDGRHANLPWLQEIPDPLTTIVWDSWVEIHPSRAKQMGINEGDMIEVTSPSGSIRAQAYLFPGLHPDAIGVPIGQGHTSLGRYADGRGANPLHILDPQVEAHTGELALHGTRVRIARTGERVRVVKDEGWKSGVVKTQAGRKLVITVAADKARLSEEV